MFKQTLCIDLPGQPIQCWAETDVKVILRKHRDVIFDINTGKGATYTLESPDDWFYDTRVKKRLRKASFSDGERLHIWVGRDFKGDLIWKQGDTIKGRYPIAALDPARYGEDPKTKPEPLLIALDHRGAGKAPRGVCTADDPLGLASSMASAKPYFDKHLSALNPLSQRHEYRFESQPPVIEEYAILTVARADEIQPQVLKQLDSGKAVQGDPDKIFIDLRPDIEPTPLDNAMATFAATMAGNDVVNSTVFKETAGYAQEHWRMFNKIGMKVFIERKAKGVYRVLLKGPPMSHAIKQALGYATAAKPHHIRAPMGSPHTKAFDGGYGRTGKAGYGGAKRLVVTTGTNFVSGMKIQVIGTVIDITGDYHTVFGQGGSQDITEFLGRAGVSLVKAGATAALGSAIAALLVAAAVALAFSPGVLLAIGAVVGGYVLAAWLIDSVDASIGAKEMVAGWAR